MQADALRRHSLELPAAAQLLSSVLWSFSSLSAQCSAAFCCRLIKRSNSLHRHTQAAGIICTVGVGVQWLESSCSSSDDEARITNQIHDSFGISDSECDRDSVPNDTRSLDSDWPRHTKQWVCVTVFGVVF